MTKRYIVSKKHFFNLVASADGMLDSLGRFASDEDLSHNFHIFSIRRYLSDNPERWLKQKFIPDFAAWMVDRNNELGLSHTTQPQLTLADVIISFQPDKFTHVETFIKKHLTRGIKHLFPEQALWQHVLHSIWRASWKIADQLMFMCDEWKMQHPAWTITLKTVHSECHIMVVQLKYGLVFIQFIYPHACCMFQKDTPQPLLNPPDFH